MKVLLRLIGLVLLAGAALQLYFVGRIAVMAAVNPESTAFERSEVFRLASTTGSIKWRQQWVPYSQISAHLKSAVIASEDATFVDHDGVDMEALEKAWDKNAKAEQRVLQSAPRSAPQKSSPIAANTAATRCKTAQNRGWFDHHTAIGKKPFSLWRTHAAAQGPGAGAHAAAGNPAEQRTHS